MIAHPYTNYREELSRLTPGLRRFARALVDRHNTDAADDLVQSALVAALGESQDRRGIRLNVWLLSNLVAVHRRGLRVATVDRHANAGNGAAPGTTGTGGWESARRASSGTKDPLGDLPLECREVYLLVVLEELTYVQAAECVGITLNAVIAHLARAREHLSRRALDLRTPARAVAGGSASVRAVPYLRVVK